MLVSRISPAPRRAASSAQATASSPVALRPPAVKTSQRSAPGAPGSPTRLASMATTTAWLPKACAAMVMSSGFLTAAELSETLSAPAATMRRMPARSRKPPPTV